MKPETSIPVSAVSTAMEVLTNIGAQFSNVAFNWSQDAGRVLTDADRAMLKKLQVEWDRAKALVSAAQEGATR